MTAANGSTTQRVEGKPGPSTRPAAPPPIRLGDIVLVSLGERTTRPMTVAGWQYLDGQLRLSGPIACCAEDHTTPAFRGWTGGAHDPARISGRPERSLPFGYGEDLAEGDGIGQWRRR